MYEASYYRQQAQKAKRLAGMVHQPKVRDALNRTARDYEEIAYDLESGAVEIRHPEMLPQRRHQG
jgi:hypothetical protein